MDDSMRYWHEVASEEAYIAHTFAEAAELAARLGGHPENRDALERTLYIAAGLSAPQLPRNDAQPDLFRGLAA